MKRHRILSAIVAVFISISSFASMVNAEEQIYTLNVNAIEDETYEVSEEDLNSSADDSDEDVENDDDKIDLFSTNTQAQTLVNIAKNELGTKERKAYSDDVKYNDWFYGKRVSNFNVKGYIGGVSSPKYPWCAVFVSWCAKEAGLTNIIPKFAGCSGGYNDTLPGAGGKKHKSQTRGGSYTPKHGDIIFFWKLSKNKNGSYNTGIHHVGIVDKVSNNNVYYIDGNYTYNTGGYHRVNYSHKSLDHYTIYGYITPKYNNPTPDPTPKPIPPSYKESNKFPTPLKCYPLKTCTTYKDANGKNVKSSIDSSKECVIKEIYDNGYAKIKCANETVYVKMSLFTKGEGVKYSTRVSSKQTVYRHSDLKTKFGDVYKTDSIKVVYEQGTKIQIIYPLDSGGYKMGWIDKSKLVGENGSLTKMSGVKTPIKTYTKSTGKTDTYSEVNGNKTGYIAGSTDLCTIKEVYTNGWLKVTYPTSKGNKTAYAKSSAFATNFKILGTTNTTKTRKVYRRSDLKESLGEVYKTDEIKVIGENGNKLQIIYPIKDGYKMGWISANYVKPVLKEIKATSLNNNKAVVGQSINYNDVSVVAYYYGGSTKTLSPNIGLLDDNDGKYTSQNTEYNEEGIFTQTFTYEENGVMCADSTNQEVIERQIVSISVVQMPYKTAYIEGDEFEPEGMVIEANYNDGSKEVITDYCINYRDDAESIILDLDLQTINISTDEAQININLNIVPKSVVSIEAISNPSKLTYIEGQSFDPTGLTLLAKYNNGTEEIITEGFEYSALNSYSIGNQDITVTYEGKTTTIPVEVIQKQPTGISIVTPPNNTNVLEGSLGVDTTGMQVRVDYNDGTNGIIQGGYTVNGYEPRTVGAQTLVINYCGFEANLDINVIAKTLERIEIDEPAEITSFIEGEELDTTGLVIYGYYNNGDVDEVYEYEISGYTSTVGNNTIVISYDGLTTSYEVNVVAKQMIGLEITSEPDKTEYLEDENLDTTGLEVSAVYDNGEKVAVPLADCNIDGYDNVPDKKSISISYNGFTAIVDVEVKAMVLSSLTLDTKPTKTTYNVGEELDLDGIAMTATYEHGKVESVNIDDCTISGFDKDKSGVQTVVISYRELSVCYVVNVKDIIDRTAILKVGNTSAIKGSTITVPVNIVNNTGVSQFSFEVTYDKATFSDFNISAASMLSSGNVSTEIVQESDDFVTRKISWTGNEDVTSNGTVLNMYLKVLETAESNSYPIEITYDEENTKNKAGEAVKLTCMHGTVIVEEGNEITRVVSGDQTSIVAGGVLNYDVSLANNTGLSAYKLNVTYDKSVMNLVNVTTGRLFGDFNVNYTDNDGVVTITGISSDINRQNGTLLRFEFTTDENAENGNYPVTIEYVPEETYIKENGTTTNVILNLIDGEVVISGYVLGDINGDGRVNNFDVMTLVGYVNNNRNLDEQKLIAADITGDGVVDYLDYASLSSYIIGLYENLDSDTETVGGSLRYKSNFVGGANNQKAVITADEIFDAQIGEYVSMNVELDRNPGMSGYIITLGYDIDELEFIDITQKEALAGGKFNVNTSVSGETTVMWSDDSIHYEDGTIFTAVFKVKNTNSEEIEVKLSYNNEHTGYIDEDLTSVPISLLSEDGVIYTDTSSPYMVINETTKDGADIAGSVTINNSDNSLTGTAQLYIASYDNDGKMLGIKIEDVTFAGTTPITKEFALQGENAKYIKTFVLEEGSIMPLMKAKMKEF